MTAAEAAQGYFVPDTSWTSTGDSAASTRVLGLPVALQGGVGSGTTTLASVVIAGADSDGERSVTTTPYVAGDQVTVTVGGNAQSVRIVGAPVRLS